MTGGSGDAARQAVRKLFGGPCACLLAAALPEQFPDAATAAPEVALAGRSNVGKSSLINALTGRKGLARASNTPGRTQQIVFFGLGDRLTLVDLPGYGHADAPPAAVAQWNGLIRRYLRVRPCLRGVLLLVDARHGLLAPDRAMMALLDEAAVAYRVVLTKADKIGAAELARRQEEVEAHLKKHPAALPDILVTSSAKASGLDEARAWILGLATGA